MNSFEYGGFLNNGWNHLLKMRVRYRGDGRKPGDSREVCTMEQRAGPGQRRQVRWVTQITSHRKPTYYTQEGYQMQHLLHVPGAHLYPLHPKNPFTQNLREEISVNPPNMSRMCELLRLMQFVKNLSRRTFH